MPTMRSRPGRRTLVGGSTRVIRPITKETAFMNRLSKRLVLKTLAIAAVMTMSLGAANAAGKYVLISHAPDSDSWWNTIKNAVKQAGEDFDVETDYRNPPNGDIADMSRLIEQ